MYTTLCQQVDSLCLNNYANVLLLITFSEFYIVKTQICNADLKKRFKHILKNHGILKIPTFSKVRLFQKYVFFKSTSFSKARLFQKHELKNFEMGCW